MQAAELRGGVKVYDLNLGKTLPQWLSQKQRRKLSKDEDYRRRVELLQDFGFNTASQRVKVSPDGVYVAATGVYPPQVRVFDTRELSMKFERHLDAEVVQFEILSEDYTKLVFLGVDRTLSFHAGNGAHHVLRVPRFGRDLAYDPAACELFAAGASNSLWRLDLEQGRFLSPFESSHGGVNALSFSHALQMLAAGGEDGVVSCWDARERKQVAALRVHAAEGDGGDAGEVTALRCDRSGLYIAVGTSRGVASVYDVRSARPIAQRPHRNGLPLQAVDFVNPERLVVSADARSVAFWRRDEAGPTAVALEPPSELRDLCLVPVRGEGTPTSGLLLAAGESERIMSFFVPRLGPAPRWAHFLDNLTEELEEKKQQQQGGAAEGVEADAVYANYKFVTARELESLGVADLVGSKLLRPYMHGFFMDMKLYRRVRALADPQAFERLRKKRVQEKLEAKLGQRIARRAPGGDRGSKPAVNPQLAERLLEAAKRPPQDSDDDDDNEDNEEAEDYDEHEKDVQRENSSSKKKEKKKVPEKKKVSDRFSAVFQDPDFQIDEESEDFKRIYPSGLRDDSTLASAAAAQQSQWAKEDDDSAESDSEVRAPAPAPASPRAAVEDDARSLKRTRRVTFEAGAEPTLFNDNKDDDDNDDAARAELQAKRRSRTLGERVKRQQEREADTRQLGGGNVELTFESGSGAKKGSKMKRRNRRF